MKAVTVKTLNNFTALSDEELEMIDGGESLNERLGIVPEREDSNNGVSIGIGGVTIHDGDVDINFSGELYPPKITATITIRI